MIKEFSIFLKESFYYIAGLIDIMMKNYVASSKKH